MFDLDVGYCTLVVTCTSSVSTWMMVCLEVDAGEVLLLLQAPRETAVG